MGPQWGRCPHIRICSLGRTAVMPGVPRGPETPTRQKKEKKGPRLRDCTRYSNQLTRYTRRRASRGRAGGSEKPGWQSQLVRSASIIPLRPQHQAPPAHIRHRAETTLCIRAFLSHCSVPCLSATALPMQRGGNHMRGSQGHGNQLNQQMGHMQVNALASIRIKPRTPAG